MEDARRGAGYESFEETVEDSLRQGGIAFSENSAWTQASAVSGKRTSPEKWMRSYRWTWSRCWKHAAYGLASAVLLARLDILTGA